jgi:hypothetical protein
MPHPTREGHNPVPQQGRPPMAAPPAEPPTPVLFEGIDPILLARLYPEEVASGVGAASAKAMEAGNAAREQGATLAASQQEPIVGLEEPPPPAMPAREQRERERSERSE